MKEIFKLALLTIIIVAPIRLFVAQPFVVNGASMYPTFETGQYLIVDQISYKFHEPRRGDVIVFRFPQDKSKYFIKRIVGLPGETVRITDQEVRIISAENLDGVVLEEPFIESTKSNNLSVKLAEDEYFVMGDNRAESLDSRIWGPLQENYIIGRAFVRLLPAETLDYLPGKYNY